MSGPLISREIRGFFTRIRKDLRRAAPTGMRGIAGLLMGVKENI